MSFQEANAPVCIAQSGRVSLTIESKEKDLGEMTVRRVLPADQRQMVGPFIFFDHMGPATFPPGLGISVRPHPHIGIATITYLFEGEIMHRDSLGYALPIQPGAVNLMTAGRGIVHSERAGSDLQEEAVLHGIQSWMALPDGLEEIEPAFVHTPANDLPRQEIDGAQVTVIVGDAYGLRSPVQVKARTLYLDCQLATAATLELPDHCAELAVYVVQGRAVVGDTQCGEGTMAVATSGSRLKVHALEETRIMVIGGETIGERHLWWNFVSSSPTRIETAKQDWRDGKFDSVEGDEEFIPLPFG